MYQTLVNLIRDTAKAVNENGTFVHGRRSDGSLEYDGDFPQIHLYPFNGVIDIQNNYSGTYDVLMAFWEQDSPDTTNEQREEIIAKMDTLCKMFILQFDNSVNGVVSNIQVQPQYRTLSATLSGYALSFRVNLSETKC